MTTLQTVIGRGTHASRPAAGVAGSLYYETDTSTMFRDNGTGWDSVEAAAGLSSPLTTKGDVWGYGSADARVPVGSNGQVLTADSTQTLGVKWAAGGGGTGLPSGGASSQVVGYGGSSGTGAWVLPPGYEIGYDTLTSTVTVSSTTEASPTTIISCAAHTFDGAAVLLEFYAPYWNAPGGQGMRLGLYEGGSPVERIGFTSVGQVAGLLQLRFTPSAGSHTYTIGGFTSSGNGGVGAGTGAAGQDPPAFVRFTKV